MRTAFSQQRQNARRKTRAPRRRFAGLEFLESKVLLSAFSESNMNGPWTFAGTSEIGGIQFDNAGNIAGGALIDASDSTVTPAGTYAIGANGTVSMTLNSAAIAGAMNGTRDVIAMSGTTVDQSLSVLVSGGSASFSDNDLNGAWTIEVNNSNPGSNGGGTIQFDGNGDVTGGTVTDGNGTPAIVGESYNINPDGTLSISIMSAHNNPISFTGALNASKDVLALSPLDLQAANADQDANLVVAVRSQGSYSDADAAGTWTLETEGGNGSVVLDAAGHISSGSFTTSSGQSASLSGAYTISSAGKITLNITMNQGGTIQHFTQTGAMNASRNVVVTNAITTTADGNLSILVKSTSQGPTLTSVVPLSVATPGSPFTITDDALLQHSNAADFDGSPIQFQITSLGTGSLTLNGDPVTTFPTTVSSGDTLLWTPAAGANGAITAFSVKAFDDTLSSAAPVPVAVNVIITNSISSANVNNTWSITGTNIQGSVQFDGAGDLTGGSVTDSSGDTLSPTGNYQLQPSGLFILGPGGSDVLTGAINASKDIVAVSANSDDGGSLAVLVNSQNPLNGSFAPADLAGKWEVLIDGSTPGSNGLGSVTLNVTGNVISGSVTTGSATFNVSGACVLNADGTVTATLVDTHDSSTITLTGAMDNSKDIISLSASSLEDAQANDSPVLMELVRSAGSYSAADLKGTWIFASNGASGALTFDGAGKVSSGLVDDGNDARVITGTYTVSAAGIVTFKGTATTAGISQAETFTGAINTTRNTFIINSVSNDSNNQNNLTVLINSADHAPTLTALKPFNSANGFVPAVGALPYTLTFGQLAGNATGFADMDGDALQLQVDAPATGATIQLDGVTQSAFPFNMSAGDSITITPAAAASGSVNVFSVRAFDGVLTSAKDIPVVLTVNPEPTISVAATASAALEVNNGIKGLGTVVFTRTGPTTLPLTVLYNVSGTANDGANYTELSGSLTISAGKSAGTITITPVDNLARTGSVGVTLTTVASGSHYILAAGVKGSATVTITDNNLAPLSVAGESLSATITAGTTPFASAGTYQLFFNASDNTFVNVGGPTLPSDMGTFTYARSGANTAAVTLDGINGTVDGTITFSSATAAVFSFTQDAGTGSQSSKVTLVAAPKTSFAPSTVFGQVEAHTIVSQNGVKASGTDQAIFDQATNSSLLVVVGFVPVQSSVNSYTYEKFGPNLGIVTFTNAASNDGFTTLLYSSATKATYVSTVDAGADAGDFQHGNSAVATTPAAPLAPASLAGATVGGVISAGAPPFAFEGASAFVVAASSYTFTQTTPLVSSSGTYTYERLTPTIGYLAFDDSVAGPSFDVLTFTSATKASYVLANIATSGWQRGTAVLTFTPDFSFAAIIKQKTFVQTAAVAPTVPQLDLEGDSGAYHFGAVLVSTLDSSVTSATLTGPSPASATLDSGNDFHLNNWYASLTDLDTAFPNGPYVLNVNSVDLGLQEINFSLTGDLYPAAPFVTNYNILQTLNASHAVTVTWAKETGGTAFDWFDFQVVDPSNDDNQVFFSQESPVNPQLNGTATGITIPAGTLLPGHQYVGHLEFFKEVSQTTTAAPGSLVAAYYSALTNFNITTTV